MERGDDLWHKKVFRIFFYLVEKNILYVFIMVYIKKSTQDLYEFFRFTGLIYFLPMYVCKYFIFYLYSCVHVFYIKYI